MKSNFRIYFGIIIFAFVVFAGCKTAEDVPEKEKEHIEVTEQDKLQSTVLLIDASKEKMLENWSRAAELYTKSLKKNPGNAAAAYELAKIHAQNDQYEKALKYAKKAADIDPFNEYYVLMAADMYILNDKLDKALEMHQIIADKHPEDLSMQYNLIVAYVQLEKFDKALEVLDHIEKMIGFSEELSIEKITLFLEMEMYDKAIEETKRLISLSPEEPLYVEFLAEIYAERGQKEKAVNLYYDILKEDPGNALARLQLAEHYRQEGKLDKTFEHLKKAFQSPELDMGSKTRIMFAYYSVSEDDSEYLEQAFELMDILIDKYPEEAMMFTMYGDFLYREEKYEKARKMFIKSTKLDPDQYDVWEQMMFTSLRLDDYEFIIEYSEKAFDYFIEQPTLYYFSGVAHLEKENYKEAVELLENGVNFVVDNKQLKGQFYTLLGGAYNNLELHDKSDNAYENALEIDPENTLALNNYSYFLALRNENLEYAREMSKKANDLEENNSAYLDTYGWILYKKGEYEESEKWIKKAIEHSGDDNAVILEHYGDVLYKLGYKEEAFNYWKKAHELGNGSEFLEKKIKDKKLYE